MLLNLGIAILSSVTSTNLLDLTDMALYRHKTCKVRLKDIGLLISTGTEQDSHVNVCRYKGKAVPLQAWTGPEVSRKLRFPDLVTIDQDGGRLSALRTGRLYPQEILLVLISVTG